MDQIFHPYSIRIALSSLAFALLLPALGCSSSVTSGTGGSGEIGAPIIAEDAGPTPPADAGGALETSDAAPAFPLPPVDAAPPNMGPSCASGADCGEAEFCQRAACGDVSGTCVGMPSGNDCLAEVETSGGRVCGCDHLGYSSACFAAANGVSVLAAGDCELPSGPCTSQSDCGGASYGDATFCEPATCGAPAGSCTRIPGACPEILDPVCGCDGRSYLNECFSRFHRAGIAYGGPCRSGPASPCNSDADCEDNTSCVPDPTCTGPACAGICLASSGEGCGLDESSGRFYVCGGVNMPRTQACVAADCAGGTGTSCIFTTGSPCSDAAACPSGQICVPAIVPPGEAPASFCVVP